MTAVGLELMVVLLVRVVKEPWVGANAIVMVQGFGLMDGVALVGALKNVEAIVVVINLEGVASATGQRRNAMTAHAYGGTAIVGLMVNATRINIATDNLVLIMVDVLTMLTVSFQFPHALVSAKQLLKGQ